METILTYRGRKVSGEDVAFIRGLIAAHAGISRRALSIRLCEAWNWRQPNGALRDMVCRGLLLALHRAGEITLPPPRHTSSYSPSHRVKPARMEIDASPIQGVLADVGALTFQQVRRTNKEALFNSLIQQHHYLGYTQPVGEHLKFLVYGKERPIACFAWSSAPRHLGPRDRYIGWSAEARRKHIHGVAYNTRYLILPWVEVRHLASHLLGRMTRMLPEAWARAYGHPVYFAETFVDPARFRGTCYYAANWIFLGKTTGRGKDDRSTKKRPNRPIKDVLGYALRRDFRARLSEGT